MIVVLGFVHVVAWLAGRGGRGGGGVHGWRQDEVVAGMEARALDVAVGFEGDQKSVASGEYWCGSLVCAVPKYRRESYSDSIEWGERKREGETDGEKEI